MKQFFFILLLGSVAVSCQKQQEKAATEETKAFEAERNAFFGSLRDPADVAAAMQLTAVEFNPALMSDPKKFSQFTGNEVKAAANLGIYLSDLNYSVAFKKTETTKEYFEAAKELSGAIGIEKEVLGFLVRRYEQNLSQNDSVKNVIMELLDKSTAKLQGTDKEQLAGIAMAAYQIENLHLILGTISSYPKDMLPDDARTNILVPLFKVALQQRANIETIYSFLKASVDPQNPNKNPNYPYYANAFEELIAVYQRLNVDEKIANNQGLEIMNDAVVKELTEKVDAIRNKITSVE